MQNPRGAPPSGPVTVDGEGRSVSQSVSQSDTPLDRKGPGEGEWSA
jgi:hypothetical protein